MRYKKRDLAAQLNDLQKADQSKLDANLAALEKVRPAWDKAQGEAERASAAYEAHA